MSLAGNTAGEREKYAVARSSLLAAVGLAVAKLAVGLATNSLGILSEAAHSGLDLVAAGVTLWAVRVSQPADPEHTYGHGKFENLSALVETLLLLATCVGIIGEAIRRLILHQHIEVQVNLWAFLVVIASILVNISRSRALLRTARKYHSQALEADALHFSTDVWSSLVVLAGLVAVALGNRLGVPWLRQADAVAALGVALIVVGVSVRLGKKSVDDLLDRVPLGLADELAAAAAAVPGVQAVKQLRVRRSGGKMFADMTLTVPQTAALASAHEIADQAEEAVRAVAPAADVVIHVEPAAIDPGDVIGIARTTAARHHLAAHDIRAYQEADCRWLELHLEMEPSLPLSEAHRRATEFEKAMLQAAPQLSRVVTHLEPIADSSVAAESLPPAEATLRAAVQQFIGTESRVSQPHRIAVQSVGGRWNVSLHCRLDPRTTVAEAHRVTQQLQAFLHQRIPQLERVLIHVEPA